MSLQIDELRCGQVDKLTSLQVDKLTRVEAYNLFVQLYVSMLFLETLFLGCAIAMLRKVKYKHAPVPKAEIQAKNRASPHFVRTFLPTKWGKKSSF